MMPTLAIHVVARLLLLALIVPGGNAAFELFSYPSEGGIPEYDFSCTVACADNEFCGRDLKCHAFNCEVYYTLGHSTMTGYNSEMSGSLTCQEMRADREDVSFLSHKPSVFCNGNAPVALAWNKECGNSTLYFPYPCNPEVDIAVRFNRKCTAKPSEETGFVCFDIAPDTNYTAYFSSLPIDPSNSDQGNCTSEYNSTSHFYYTGRVIGPQVGLMYEYEGSETWNVSLATAAMASEYFEVQHLNDFPFCDEGCKDTEFCGHDGMCYSYNCENIYAYGPASVTGHGSGDTRGDITCISTLTADHYCQVPDDGLTWQLSNATEYDGNHIESQWPVALQYQCLPVGVYWSPDWCAFKRLESRYVTFNRFCEAKPNPEQNFTCFDIDPMTDMETYLEDYLKATAMNSNCTIYNFDQFFNESHYDEPGFRGRHSYAPTCTINTTHHDCAHLGSSVEDFDDYERMRAVMTSNLVGERTSSGCSWHASSVFGIVGVAMLLLFH